MATSDRDDLVSQLRALDEQLASVPPPPHLEARLRARLRAAREAPAPPALRGALRGLRRPLAAGLLAAAALALVVDDGARRAVERWGVAARRLAAPAEPIAGEPRADGAPAEPRPARPSVSPLPAPVAPAPAPRRSARPPEERRPPVEEPPSADVMGPPRVAPASPPRPSSRQAQPRRGPDRSSRRDPGGLGPSGVHEPPIFSVLRSEERVPGAAGRAGDEAAERTPEEESATPEEESATPEEESATPEEEACSTELLFDGVTCPDDCTSGVVGDGVTCKDPNALIEQGIPICEELGLVLRDLQVDKADYAVCDGKVLQAKYLCCPAWAGQPEEPRPPPPPPEPGCDTTGVVGDGTTCEDPNVLKEEALAICTSLDLPLSHFDASIAPCETGTLKATYACCP